MPGSTETKIPTTIRLTPKTETVIAAEAKRTGISFSDQLRRITDQWVLDLLRAREKPAERVVVLDRASGQLHATR